MSNRNWPLGRALVAALLVVGALRADDRITWTELPAAKVLTRFPPGVVYDSGAWKGWYDVTKLGPVQTTAWGEVNDWGYCWAFSAVNMAARSLPRGRRRGECGALVHHGGLSEWQEQVRLSGGLGGRDSRLLGAEGRQALQLSLLALHRQGGRV